MNKSDLPKAIIYLGVAVCVFILYKTAGILGVFLGLIGIALASFIILKIVIKYTSSRLKIEDVNTKGTLLEPYGLRAEEEKQWNKTNPEDSLKTQDSDSWEKISTLIHALNSLYSTQEKRKSDYTIETADDSTVADLCGVYRTGTDLVRSFIRSKIDSRCSLSLLIFSKRAAFRGFRSGDINLIRDSLIAHAIENLSGEEDIRERLINLDTIYFYAKAIHPNPASIVYEVAEISGPAISSILMKHLVKKPV